MSDIEDTNEPSEASPYASGGSIRGLGTSGDDSIPIQLQGCFFPYASPEGEDPFTEFRFKTGERNYGTHYQSKMGESTTPEPQYSGGPRTYVGRATEGPGKDQELTSDSLSRFGYAQPDDEEPIGRYDYRAGEWHWTAYDSVDDENA